MHGVTACDVQRKEQTLAHQSKHDGTRRHTIKKPVQSLLPHQRIADKKITNQITSEGWAFKLKKNGPTHISMAYLNYML